MPFKTFHTWLFDGDLKAPIPVGNNVPDIVSYKSPITHMYMVSMFLNQGKLNHYLNKYFNKIGLFYLERTELMKFLKKCVIDFKIQRRNLPYIPRTKNTKLFDAFKKKFPLLKKYDIQLMCDMVDSSENKSDIYYSLGLEKMEKIKKQKSLKKKTKKEKQTIKDFLKENFETMDVT